MAFQRTKYIGYVTKFQTNRKENMKFCADYKR